MEQDKFTYEYKEKLDFLVQQAKSPKLKEIIIKFYDLPQSQGEILLKAIEKGVFT